VKLSTNDWRLVGFGGNMEMKEIRSRETSLNKYYGVRMVANIFPIFSNFFFPLVKMEDF